MSQPREESARQALEHLQRAVLETIAAARSALDVAEELVRDPAHLAGLAAAMATIADAVGGIMNDAMTARRHEPGGRPGDNGANHRADRNVEHISVG
ncbi:MAG TPA: hypothetical protein VF954_04375 [Acidimicrobiales bacterium]